MNKSAAICVNFFFEHIPEKILPMNSFISFIKDFFVPLGAVALGACLTHIAYKRQQQNNKISFEERACTECFVVMVEQLEQVLSLIDSVDEHYFKDDIFLDKEFRVYQTHLYDRSKIHFLYLEDTVLYNKISGSLNNYVHSIEIMSMYDESCGNYEKRKDLMKRMIVLFEVVLDNHMELLADYRKFIADKYGFEVPDDLPKKDDFERKKDTLLRMVKKLYDA